MQQYEYSMRGFHSDSSSLIEFPCVVFQLGFIVNLSRALHTMPHQCHCAAKMSKNGHGGPSIRFFGYEIGYEVQLHNGVTNK